MSDSMNHGPVYALVRARLRNPGTAQQLHDQVTGATKDMAKAAGDLSHHTYLNPMDPGAFMGIDVWGSAEQLMAFSSNPQIQDFFGQLFDGPPEVTVWSASGWNEW